MASSVAVLCSFVYKNFILSGSKAVGFTGFRFDCVVGMDLRSLSAMPSTLASLLERSRWPA
eukprot:4047898-Amphidinium_carterae.2